MWDIIAHLIHALIVFALSLVGVTVKSEAEAERHERLLDSLVSYDVPASYVRACEARLAWSESLEGAAVVRETCLTLPAEPAQTRAGAHPATHKGVPAFIEHDELAS